MVKLIDMMKVMRALLMVVGLTNINYVFLVLGAPILFISSSD